MATDTKWTDCLQKGDMNVCSKLQIGITVTPSSLRPWSWTAKGWNTQGWVVALSISGSSLQARVSEAADWQMDFCGVCSHTDAVQVFCDKERAECERKSVSLLVDLRFCSHLWPQVLGGGSGNELPSKVDPLAKEFEELGHLGRTQSIASTPTYQKEPVKVVWACLTDRRCQGSPRTQIMCPGWLGNASGNASESLPDEKEELAREKERGLVLRLLPLWLWQKMDGCVWMPAQV